MLTDLHVGSMVMLLVLPIFSADGWPKEATLVPETSRVAVTASERVARRAVGALAHSRDERQTVGVW